MDMFRRGFTLSETLIAAGGLGLVTLVVALLVNTVRSELKMREVRTQLAVLDEALGAYHQAAEFWPTATPEEPDDSLPLASEADRAARVVVTALMLEPASQSVMERLPAGRVLSADEMGAYLAEAATWPVEESVGQWVAVDAWGRPMRCLTAQSSSEVAREAVSANRGKPVFISAGPDGRFGMAAGVADADNLRSDELVEE
jgi:type II secretory pathway pseudopilin PulG